MSFEILTSTPLRHVPPDYTPPGAHRWFTLTAGPDTGRRLFYFDHTTGTGVPEQTIVLVHGNPECSYTYRHVVAALLADGRPLRIVAMDHLGFGLSDQASFEMVEMHHAANLTQLVHALDLREVTLVIHDWGGPIGIGAFIDEPERLAALVVLNTSVFPMPARGMTYTSFPYPWLAWSWTPHLVPNVSWGGAAGYVVTHGEPQRTATFLKGMARALTNYHRKGFDPDSPQAVFSGQFRSRANTVASKRHVRQTPYWGHGYRYNDPTHGPQDNTAYYRHIQATLPKIWGPAGRAIPVLGFFGSWDPCGKPEVIDQWHQALPQMCTDSHVFPDNGHFIEEHRGPEIATAILKLDLTRAGHGPDNPAGPLVTGGPQAWPGGPRHQHQHQR